MKRVKIILILILIIIFILILYHLAAPQKTTKTFRLEQEKLRIEKEANEFKKAWEKHSKLNGSKVKNPEEQLKFAKDFWREKAEKRINRAKRSAVVMIISKNKFFLVGQGNNIIAIKTLSFSSNGIKYDCYAYNHIKKSFTKIIDSEALYEDKDFRKSKLFFECKGISIEWSYPCWIYMPKNANMSIALTNFSDINQVNLNDNTLKWITKQSDVELKWPKKPIYVSKSENTTQAIY